MKALILAAGECVRLRPLTNDIHKCLIEVEPDVRVIDIQLGLLQKCDIRSVVISTGHAAQKVEEYIRNNYSEMNVTFVFNKDYATTNCIYSTWLAREFLDDDLIFMTGDLVFEEGVLTKLLSDSNKDVMYVNSQKEKVRGDFFVRTDKGYIEEIALNVDGEQTHDSFPIYKLSKNAVRTWLDEIGRFVEKDEVNVYAENAYNNVSDKIKIMPHFMDDFCMEVDTHEDLKIARSHYQANKV